MKLARFIEYLLERRALLVRFCLGVLAVLVLLDAMPLIVDKEHAHTRVERWPCFWALFGLLGCVALILFAKAIGGLGIVRGEDYYDE